jgi:hypothetical protein
MRAFSNPVNAIVGGESNVQGQDNNPVFSTPLRRRRAVDEAGNEHRRLTG